MFTLNSIIANSSSYATIISFLLDAIEKYKDNKKNRKFETLDVFFKIKYLSKLNDEYADEKLDEFITKNLSEFRNVDISNMFSESERNKQIETFFSENTEMLAQKKEITNIMNSYFDTLNNYVNNILSLESKIIINELKKSTISTNKQVEGLSKQVDSISKRVNLIQISDRNSPEVEKSEFYKSKEYKNIIDMEENNEFQDAITLLKKIVYCYEGEEQKNIYYYLGFFCLKYASLNKDDEKLFDNACFYMKKALCSENEKYFIFNYDIYAKLSFVYEEKSAFRNPKENYSNALTNINKALELVEKNKLDTILNEDDLINIKLQCARIYENLFEFIEQEKINKYLDESLKIYNDLYENQEKINDENKFVLFNNMGRIYEKKAEMISVKYLDDALRYYFEATKVKSYCNLENNPLQFALVNNNIGNIYFKKISITEEDYRNLILKSLKHYSKALTVYSLTCNKYKYAQTKTNIGRVYDFLYKKNSEETDFRKSEENIKESLKIRTINDCPVDYGKSTQALGILYYHKGKKCEMYLREAEEKFNDCLDVFTKEKYPKQYSFTISFLGDIYYEMGKKDYKDYQKSLEYYKEVLEMTKDEKNSIIFKDIIYKYIKVMYKIFIKYDDKNEQYKWCNEQLEFIRRINCGEYAFNIYYNLAVMLLNKFENENNNNDDKLIDDAINLLNEYEEKAGMEVSIENELEQELTKLRNYLEGIKSLI